MIEPKIYKNCANDINGIQVSLAAINTVANNTLVPLNNLLYVYNNSNPSSLNQGNSQVNWFQPMIDNINQIILSASNTSTTTKTLNFVQSLQSHVQRNFGSVNGYLQANNIKVGQQFANVSASVGYVITPNNIE